MQEGDSKETLELDIDQFNGNPCMGTLMRVIRQLHTTIAPPAEDGTNMPQWVREIHKAFTAPGKKSLVRSGAVF